LLPPLEYKNVISIVEEKTTTTHSPLLVITEDIFPYYSKTPQGHTPEFSIINEFLCSNLLYFWNIKTPEFAALKITPSIIDKPLSYKHKNEYFERHCFGSKQLPNKTIEFHELYDLRRRRDFHMFSNALNILKIGLFDLWVENADRREKNANLLISEDINGLTLYAIDHAICLSGLSMGLLNEDEENWAEYDQSVLATKFAKSVYHNVKNKGKWFEDIRQYFYLSIAGCKNSFEKIITNIPYELGLNKEHKLSLFNYLFSDKRNKKILYEFFRRLKH
jgi:hypothetical protein